MVDSTIFIGAIIIAIVQAIKEVFPQVSGALTTFVAVAIGALVAVFAPHLGVAPLSVAQGILTGLASAGVHTVASSVSTKRSV